MELSGRRWTTFFYSPVLKSSFHFTVQINKGDSPNSSYSIFLFVRETWKWVRPKHPPSHPSPTFTPFHDFLSRCSSRWAMNNHGLYYKSPSLHEFQFAHISRRQYFLKWYFIELQVSSYHMINTGLESISGDHEGFRKHNTNMHVD